MADMTPVQSRRLARIWMWAAAAVGPAMVVLIVLGVHGFNGPLFMIGSLFMARAAFHHGRVDGHEAAEKKFAHAVRCHEVAPSIWFVQQDHEHRCVQPVLECEPKRGRPEHSCHCGMTWIVGTDAQRQEADA